MAKDYMDQQMKLNLEYLGRIQGLNGSYMRKEEMKQYFTPYTVDELMEKAQEFYDFIQKPGSKL